jgi:hypothetical protein
MPDWDHDLEVIRSGDGPTVSDETTKSEIEELEVDQERERKRLVNLGLEQALNLRKEFAWDIFYLIIAWLAVLFVLLIFQGFAITVCGHNFRLSDSVVLALIGGTTVNVLGIFIIVVRHLFPQRPL